MRVLHVIPSLGPLRGGPSLAMKTMAEGLARAGIDAQVAATDDDGPGKLNVPRQRAAVERGVTYRYFPRQSSFYTFSWPLTRWLAQTVPDYDLLHIHALFSYAALPAAYYATRAGVPYIVRPLGVLNRWGMENRHPRLKKLSFKLIESRILKRATAVHYTSKQEHREAEGLGDWPSVVIPNPVEMAPAVRQPLKADLRARYPQMAGRKIILFLSRLDPKKGLDLLLPAFAEARRSCPDALLLLAGSGDPRFMKHLLAEAERLKIDSEILWAGFLEGEEKWAAFAAADVFVLPSYSENFGVAVVEAMSSGVPVIVSDQVGIHEKIAAAHAGVVARCSVDDMKCALIRLLKDPERASEMGRNGRVLAQAEFSQQSVTQKLIGLYHQVLCGRPQQQGAGSREP